MANTKILADGNGLTVWFALPGYAADPANPTAAEINASLDITCAIAWEGWSFGAQQSNQNSDPAMCDVGDVQTRGFAQFGGDISFFYPYDYTDASNPLVDVFLALEDQWTEGYIIIRADGVKTTSGQVVADKPAVDGDFVSIYKVLNDASNDNDTGELSYKYSWTFLAQGSLWVNAIVGSATVSTPAPIGTPDYSVGGKTPLSAYFTGRQLASVTGEWSGTPSWFDWESSDPSAAVDRNGVVTGISAGTAEITATDPVSGAVSAPLEITIA